MIAWLLILFGVIISMGVAMDPAGWDDPVFNVARKLPYTPYSWSAILAASVGIYAIGELMSDERRVRGRVVIAGASLCFVWCLSMSCMMARMVYELPVRITVLWPFVMFFVAALYASRIIVYASAFTGARWSTNPYQLWDTMFVVIISLSQIIIGVAPGTIFTEVERPVMLQLALVNFIGSALVIFGLHLKNTKLGENYELAGAFSLVLTLAWYCYSVTNKQVLAGTYTRFRARRGIRLRHPAPCHPNPTAETCSQDRQFTPDRTTRVRAAPRVERAVAWTQAPWSLPGSADSVPW